MKIALIDPALYTIPYDQALLNGLQAAGHEVTLFGKVAEAGGEQWEIPGLNAHFHRYIRSIREKSVPRAVFLAARGLSHLEGMWRLPTALRRLRPDIIHLQWTPLPAVDAMVLPRLRRIAPLVLTIHDTNYLNGAVSSHLVKLGGDRIHTFFDHLIVHTEDARRKLMARGLGHKDISIVPHGLLHEGELPAPRSRPAGAPLNLLQFGKIKPYKGVDVLIDAVAQIPATLRHRLRVHVVGKPILVDGDDLIERAHRLGVDDTIVFRFGFVPREEMVGLIGLADMLALPYREIDGSGVLMTAIAAGRPVIATRTGVFAELLEHDCNALLAEPGDSASLATQLSRLLAQDDLLATLTVGAQALQAATPSWIEIAHQTAAIYDGLFKVSTVPAMPLPEETPHGITPRQHRH
jgi:glycosyltransferase involved in cell wall biosynthesis